MSNRYFDSESAPRGAGSSYTDRFRTDAPLETHRASSSSGPTTTARLVNMIGRACRPSLVEPDLALNLEIADIINQKKGTAPREAAVEIAKLINSRTPHVSILAMACLDICVKNCGYPFHLQISRKEFLNELVRKFPEKPPMTYSRTQTLILEAIEEWRQTICRTSRYKDDLGYIRDMHRLLSYKGYAFPEINRDDAAVLNPSDTLRSAQELEREEREAQSAKLQELIRRGTPTDLQEANRLMSVMAGFRESKVDYHAKAAKDLDKLRRKAEILEEMLANISASDDPLPDDDVFSELISALKTAAPKIQKMIDEEGQDEDAIGKLLALNDYIHALIEKYDLAKRGDIAAAVKVEVNAVPGTDTEARRARLNGSTKAALIESLIDIDDEDTTAGGAGAQPENQASPDDLLGDLDGLSFGSGFGQGGNIALGLSPRPPNATTSVTTDSSASSLTGLGALIDSPKPTPPAKSLGGLLDSPQTHSRTSSLLDDSDWTFTSAQPAAASAPAPSSSALTVLDSESLRADFAVSRSSPTSVSIVATYTNKAALKQITNLNFLLAVPKQYTLKMDPQTGSSLPPHATNPGAVVTQTISIQLPPNNVSAHSLKLKWKVSYNLAGQPEEHSGTLDNIAI